MLTAEYDLIASHVRLPNRAVIGKGVTPALDGRTLANVTPRDGSVLNQVAACGPADIDATVAAGRAAFETGPSRSLAPRDRRKTLLRLAQLLEDNAGELALLETLDTGKPISETRSVDVPLAIGTLRYYAEAIDKVYGEVGPSGPDRISWAVHEPLGVIGAITPWNFPLHLAMWKVAPAIAMGNSVVLQPAEQSPLTALRLGEFALEAGLPAGVLNVIPGLGGEAGSALSRHMDVDMVAFTGSVRVGRMIMRDAGESNLKRVSLELGGKSPHIDLADCADIDAAVAAVAWGVLYNQGQVCTAGSRLIFARDIRDVFVEKLIAYIGAISPGDPLDPSTRLGTMISESQLAGVLARVERAVTEGARLLCGGDRLHQETGGFYMAPTVLDQVRNDMSIAREETFGPVLSVITVADADDALRTANDNAYGLAAGVWTGNIDTALRMARGLRSGLVWVNGWDSCDITMPFGGFKQSGFGRDRSLHALHKYADIKFVTITIGGDA
jgi:gamma-glutamyl-gamma-aminobutyraldehyde dehydrogenase